MKTTHLLTLLALSLHTMAMAAPASPITDKDGLVRDAEGRTLYTFAKDTPGRSNCVDACTKSWQPFLAKKEAVARDQLSLIARDGEGNQWAYRGQALYYFVGDRNVGDTNGEGLGGVWHAAHTAPASAAPAPAAASYSY